MGNDAPRDEKPPKKKKPLERPTIGDLDLIALLARTLPAPSLMSVVDESDKRFSRQSLEKAIDKLGSFCKSPIVSLNANNEHDLTQVGRQLLTYASVILKTHLEIRVWPPVYHIVIAASQRTASSYLPSFLLKFVKLIEIEGTTLPFQITVRESDSRDDFFSAIRTEEADLGLRGLPVSDDRSVVPVPEDLIAMPFGPTFRLCAVSKQELGASVSVREMLDRDRVGILKMDIESVVAVLSQSGDQVFFPRRNVFSCESYTTMMSFINHGLCTGLIYVPPHAELTAGLHKAELSDLASSTRCFVFCKKATSAKLKNIVFPEHRKDWQRDQFLASLLGIFWDEEAQKMAFSAPF